MPGKKSRFFDVDQPTKHVGPRRSRLRVGPSVYPRTSRGRPTAACERVRELVAGRASRRASEPRSGSLARSDKARIRAWSQDLARTRHPGHPDAPDGLHAAVARARSFSVRAAPFRDGGDSGERKAPKKMYYEVKQTTLRSAAWDAQFPLNTHCGDTIELRNRYFVVDKVTVHYKLEYGKYRKDDTRLHAGGDPVPVEQTPGQPARGGDATKIRVAVEAPRNADDGDGLGDELGMRNTNVRYFS